MLDTIIIRRRRLRLPLKPSYGHADLTDRVETQTPVLDIVNIVRT